MPVRIRLTRKGKKSYAYYHIIVADSRAPRDGKYIERLGSYNPNTDPATVQLDFGKALEWLNNGALPSDTCRSILSKQGVLMKKHLLEGVKKGAFNEEEAEAKFQAWLKNKEAKVAAEKKQLAESSTEELKQRMADEAKKKEEIAQKVAAKKKEALEAQLAAAKTAEGEEGEANADENAEA